MTRFIEAESRAQATLFPERIDDYIDEDNSVRAIEAFVDMLDLERIGFHGMMPKATGRPAYHPSTMLKLYIYGYLNRDKNFTPAKVKRRVEEIEKSIERYFARLDRVDQEEPTSGEQPQKLEDKIASLKKEVERLKGLEQEVLQHPDKQISLTDPDARSMRLRGTGIVGYNVQTAVDVEHHLIVAHEVTTQNNDRSQLFSMSNKARAEMGIEDVQVIADRGYYKGIEIKACEDAGITTYVPHTDTSGNRARGRYVKSNFRYFPEEDVYRCPAGDTLKWRMTTVEKGQNNHRYWSSNCQTCRLKSKCTPSKERRVTRWEHEDVLDQAKKRLARDPEKMRIRAQTVEHPFGTLKHWMGATHFQMTRLEHVSTEMSLHVLAYNIKRVINIIGVKALIEAIEALILRLLCCVLQLNSAVLGVSRPPLFA